MAAVAVTSSQSVSLEKNFGLFLYLFCLEDNVHHLPVDSVPCLSVNCFIGHFSPVNRLLSRRVCMFADNALQTKLKGVTAPVLIQVKTSCEAKWLDEDKNPTSGILIWDFNSLPSAPGPWIKADNSEAEHMPEAPLLDTEVQCNCTQGHYGHVIISTKTPRPANRTFDLDAETLSSSDSDGTTEEDVEENEAEQDKLDDDESTIYSASFYCAGCTFPESQQNVRDLRKIAAHGVPDIRLVPQPDNLKDSNAINIQAELDQHWQSIGYVRVSDIPRVHEAFNTGTFRSICLNKIIVKYHPSAPGGVYFQCYVTMTKVGKWKRADQTNYYNKDLHI